MTKDEQRRALELLNKLQATDETIQTEVKAFLASVEAIAPIDPNKTTERIANKYREWIDMAVAEIAKVASERDTFTADELNYLTPPTCRCMGAAFRKAACERIIEAVEFCQSDKRNGHLLRRWRLASPDLGD